MTKAHPSMGDGSPKLQTCNVLHSYRQPTGRRVLPGSSAGRGADHLSYLEEVPQPNCGKSRDQGSSLERKCSNHVSCLYMVQRASGFQLL